MSGLLQEFARVTRRTPCPVCGKGDWCLTRRGADECHDDVVCARVESPRRWGEAGWLHVRREGPRPWRASVPSWTAPLPPARFGQYATLFASAVDMGTLARFAGHLGVSAHSLIRLGIGWLSRPARAEVGLRPGAPCWTFPMRDASGRVIGIRLRTQDGRKFALQGSRNGLILANDITRPVERVFVTEGESDTGALLDLGVVAIGRAGCTQGSRLLAALVGRLRPCEVVVVTDADRPGKEGARALAKQVAPLVRSLRVIEPPPGIKDARDWRRAGLTTELMSDAVELAPRWSVRVVSGRPEVVHGRS